MLKDFTKEKFDVIILSGQSNAVGNGMGEVENPWEPDDRVWFMVGPQDEQEFYLTPAVESVRNNETVGNLCFTFARRYLAAGMLQEGRKLLILCCAVGGTGFLKGEWRLKDIYYERMMAMIRTALGMNPENRLVSLLWHQGETDVRPDVTFDIHYNHVMTLLRTVREEFQVPEIPFIAGDFVYDWKNKVLERANMVVDAIRAVCKDCGHGMFIETSDLKSNMQQLNRPTPTAGVVFEDDIHFSRASLYELGERYFKAFCQILGK